MDEIDYRTHIYTDMQSIKQVQYKGDLKAQQAEVALQFEALMMQMVFKSMRDATSSLSGGLLSNHQMELYEDLFDKQIALMLSNSKLGFAKIVEHNLDQVENKKNSQIDQSWRVQVSPANNTTINRVDKLSNSAVKEEPLTKQNNFSSPEDFVTKLWSNAKKAAHYLGTLPEILLAQAALETNWGKSIIDHAKGNSSHNLFNIKADASWSNKTTTINTLEQKNGTVVKEAAKFRSYDSYKESFMDYVAFLKTNPIYKAALNHAGDPEKFVHALSKAGYATDSQYAEKILSIFSSTTFKNLIAKARENDF